MSELRPMEASPSRTPSGGQGAGTRHLWRGVKNAAILVGFLLAVLLFFQVPAFAQEGTILGTVTDPSGAAVPNATVTILNINTSAVRKVTTNSAGYYIAPSLSIGNYTVSAQAEGFKQSTRTGITLSVAERLTQNFALQLGQTHQTVTVEANPIQVQTSSGAVSTMITGQQLSKLSTNGHTFYRLIALMPGVSSQMSSYMLAVPTGGGSANVSVNGQRMSHNIFLLDGGEDSDRGGGGNMSILPSQEALSEFRTMTSNYSPQYGLSSAGTFTMALKSGTNKFHAEAWEFFRNDWLDAIEYPNLPKDPVTGYAKNPKLRQNIFGFNVGGPVSLHQSGHHKTFFFYNMEWRRYVQAGGSLNTGVPAPSIYSSLGSGAVFPAAYTASQLHTPCASNVSPAIAQQYANAGLTLSNCSGTTPVYEPFPNNTIPANLIDPNATALLGAGIFGPTSGLVAPSTGNDPGVYHLVAAPSVPTSLREEIVRIDHTFNDKFSVFGHYIAEAANQNLATSMWSGDNMPTIGTNFKNPAYSAVIHTTYSISPTLLNEAAFNYNGNRIHILPNGIYEQPSGYANYRVFPGPNEDNRMPAINLSGVTGTNYTSNWMPWNNAADDYQVRDDVSWVKGNHQLKFGASWAIYKKIQDLFANTQGGYTFNGFFTGSDFADFLLGNAQGYSEDAVKDAGHWNNVSWAAYVNDNWHVNNRLTLNLGLRWDGIPHTYEALNRMSNFYPNKWNSSCTGANFFNADGTINASGPASACLGASPNSILQGLQFYLNGVGISGQPGVPHGMVNDSWWNFGPRVGFAYDLTGSGKTVVRGGFGAMYERIQGNDMYNGGTNVPFSANYGTNYVSLSNAALNVQTGNTFTPSQAPILVTSFGRTILNNAYKPPVSYQYSLGMERQLSTKLVLSVGYVGAQSRHQSFQGEYNLPPESDLAGLQNGTLDWNSVVPYQGFHGIPMVRNEANGYYNSLQIQLRGHLTRNITVQSAYTFSKSVDTGTNGSSGGDLGTLSNPYDWGYNYGPSSFDERSIFTTGFYYSLPFFMQSSSATTRSLLGGWQFSGIVSANTGYPLNMTVTGNSANNGVQTGATNMPDLSGNVSYPKTNAAWFSGNFSNPAPGTWGNLPYNSIYGPGTNLWDMSLFKEFQINQDRGTHLELRFETYNTFNHVNPSAISTGYGSSNFGEITGYNTQRTIELGARIFF